MCQLILTISDVDVTSVQKRSGGFTSQSIRVRYTTGSDSVKMNLKLKRKGLLWKVQMDQGYYKDQGLKLVQKYSIAVPKGSDVVVDKINVSDSVTPGKKIDGMDTYTLDAVFGAEHYVEISGKDVEKTGQLVSWTEGDPAIVQTDYNEKVVEELAKQGMEDWKIIMNALVNRKLFSEVDLLQNVDGTNKDAVIDEFESVRDYEFGGSSGDSEKINKYQFTNGEANVEINQEDGTTLAQVTLKGNYYYSYNTTYWSGNSYHNERDGQTANTLTYIMKDGKWVLYNISLSPFYD